MQQEGSIAKEGEAAVTAHKLDEEVVAAAAMECTQGEANAASTAKELAATAAAQENSEKMSMERIHGTREAAVATMTTKIEGDMLRSQNNMKDQIEEIDDEIKALIEERRNIKEEDKEQIKEREQEDQTMHQKQKNQGGKKKSSEYRKSSNASRTSRASNLRRKEHTCQR